jgi:hypothetical protein
LEACEQWPETGVIADLLNAAWSEVDWREIGEHWIEDDGEDDEDGEAA